MVDVVCNVSSKISTKKIKKSNGIQELDCFGEAKNVQFCRKSIVFCGMSWIFSGLMAPKKADDLYDYVDNTTLFTSYRFEKAVDIVAQRSFASSLYMCALSLCVPELTNSLAWSGRFLIVDREGYL